MLSSVHVMYMRNMKFLWCDLYWIQCQKFILDFSSAYFNMVLLWYAQHLLPLLFSLSLAFYSTLFLGFAFVDLNFHEMHVVSGLSLAFYAKILFCSK